MKKKTNQSNSEEIKLNIVNDEAKDIDKYTKTSLLSKIPYGVKAIFIKYWFYGAVCFFVGMGLGNLGVQGFTYVAIAGLVAGALIDIACDNILLMMDSSKNESKDYMIFKNKSIWSMLINILYAILLYYLCGIFCSTMVSLYTDPTIWFLQEPLSQALVLIIFDGVFLAIKYLIKVIVRKNKEKKAKKVKGN